MLLLLTDTNFKFKTFPMSFVRCFVWYLQLSDTMPPCYVWTAKESRKNCTHLSFSDSVVSLGFFLTNAANSHQTIYTTCKLTFFLAVSFQTPCEVPLALQSRPRLTKPQHAFSFLYLRRHFNNCESTALGGKIWKLKRHEL
jgi:hypothetical protein